MADVTRLTTLRSHSPNRPNDPTTVCWLAKSYLPIRTYIFVHASYIQH